MFWGCLCYNGKGTLVTVDGTMDSNKYINTPDTHLWPVVAKHFGNQQWIFMEDNAPCHVSRASNNWKTQNNIETLEWPPQSPDLKLKLDLEKRLHEIKTQTDLVRVVNEIWSSLSPDYIQGLYQTLPTRISAVMMAKGYINKF